MAPVFGEGGNLPTRFFELDGEMLKREGFDFEKFAKKVRDSGSRVVHDSRFDPRAGYARHLHVRKASTTSRSTAHYRPATSARRSRELFERMPTRPALAEPEVSAHKPPKYEDDSNDFEPSARLRAEALALSEQPVRRRPVRSTRNEEPVNRGEKTIGGAPSKRSAPLVRVGTELRFELIAKPALASHVHGADPRPTPYRCFTLFNR